MNFELVHTDPHSAARAGVITTGHGTIETPIFMPVGTVGSVKGVFHRDLQQEVGAVFAQVLEHAGVYKRTPEGQAAFLRFVDSVR